MASSEFGVNTGAGLTTLTYQPTTYRWVDPDFRYTMNGQVRIQGKPSVIWTRDITNQNAVGEWFGLIGSDYSKSVTIRTLVYTGSTYTWQNFTAIMLRPTIQSSHGLVHERLEIQFIQLESV